MICHIQLYSGGCIFFPSILFLKSSFDDISMSTYNASDVTVIFCLFISILFFRRKLGFRASCKTFDFNQRVMSLWFFFLYRVLIIISRVKVFKSPNQENHFLGQGCRAGLKIVPYIDIQLLLTGKTYDFMSTL